MNAKHNNEITDLMIAASQGDWRALQSILSEGAKINERDSFGHTALCYAVSGQHPEAVLALLNNGADPQLKGPGGRTPLEIAQAKGYSEIAQMLKNSCLMHAVRDSDLATVNKLLDDGADVNANLNDGWSPLMVAALGGQAEVVQGLLSRGANVNAANNNGWTALMIAETKRHSEVVQLIKQYSQLKLLNTNP